MPSLEHLPDDILLEILSHLDTARDVARLSTTCRHMHTLARQGGWRGFVRGRFSTLALADADIAYGGRWDRVADRLTRQARAWERRAFQVVAYTDAQGGGAGNFFKGYPDSSHPFSPVLDADVVLGGGHELVVWGAGEDVVGRFRPVGADPGGPGDAWFRMQGKQNGHQPVMGDVTAIKLATPGGQLGMFVGRASGDLRLISAEPGTAGTTIGSFDLPLPPVGAKAASWSSVGYIDVLQEHNTVVAGNRSTLCVFPLGSTESGSVVQALDLRSFAGPDGNPRFIHDAKAVSADTLACALGTDEEPLRLFSVTPAGLSPKTMAKESRLMTAMEGGKQTTIRALETVGSGVASFRGGNSLLTAWDDGTIRLVDPRTPSPRDAVFRDTVDPYEKHSSLLTWGGHHFVAGSNDYPRLKTFDYRWPAGAVLTTSSGDYRPTDAVPCSGMLPFPPPPSGGFDDDGDVPEEFARPSRCDHGSGRRCTYHWASRTAHYRPNSCLILESGPTNNRQRPARIHSLAKSSDAAGSFYVGLPSAIAEMQTASGEEDFDGEGGHHQPSKAVRSAASRRGWRADGAEYCLIETGHGRVDLDGGYPGLGVSTFSPRLVRKEWHGALVWTRPEVRQAIERTGPWHRWSRRFWDMRHFGLPVPGFQGDGFGDIVRREAFTG